MDLTTTSFEVDNSNQAVEFSIFYAILFALLILAAAVFNLCTIFVFWKLPSLRENPSELLILNLAVADLTTGVLIFPIAAPLYVTPGHWPMGESGCKAAIFCLNLGIHGSLFALTTISIDRFLLVYMEYPKYMKMVTRRRIYTVIFSGWIFVFVTIAVELGMWQVAKKIDATARDIPFDIICLSPPRRVREFSLTFFLSLYFFPVILVCGLSLAFLWQLKNRLAKTVRKHPSSSSGPKPTTLSTTQLELHSLGSCGDLTNAAACTQRSRKINLQTRNRYIKPGVTLLALVLAMAICMLPYCFYVIIIESGCDQCNKPKVLFSLLLLQFCNSVLDPFVYVLTRRKIRKFYRSCLTLS